MKYPRAKQLYKFGYILFYVLILLTVFIPAVQLDRYVEYSFDQGYYNEQYQAYSEPIATEISPAILISNLKASQSDVAQKSVKYHNLKSKLDKQLKAGQITEEEYNDALINSVENNEYIAVSLSTGHDKSLSRLKEKMHLYTMVILAFYCLVAFLLFLSVLNFFKPKKLLDIANVYGSWVILGVYIIFNLYTFGLAISSVNNIEGFNGTIKEEITICMSPKIICFVLISVLVLYGITTTILERLDNKIAARNKEIPIFVSEKIKNGNRYRKINSKKE